MTPGATASKAVYVDGASAMGSKHRLRIETMNYAGLYNLLTQRVGTCQMLAHIPLITIHPDRLARQDMNGLAKDVAGAGFKLLPATSTNSVDDSVLMSKIECLDPRVASEIVVLTNDKDFVPVLRYKKSQGFRIYWVGTQHPERNSERSRLSSDVLSLCDAGVFDFVELGDHVQRISCERAAKLSPPATCAGPDNLTEFCLSYKCNNLQQHLKLASEITRLVGQFPGLKVKVTK